MNIFLPMLYATREMEGGVTTNTRIKKLRKALDLTQAEFAARIGSTANVLTHYETGRRNPSSSVVNNICKEFHVSEKWLRTGSGEMFLELSKEEEISAFVENMLRDESADFKRRLIAALARLDDAGWTGLEQLIEDTARRNGIPITPDHPPADPPRWTAEEHAIWESEARAEAEEVYHQILREKKAAAESSASPPDLLA